MVISMPVAMSVGKQDGISTEDSGWSGISVDGLMSVDVVEAALCGLSSPIGWFQLCVPWGGVASWLGLMAME